MARTRNAPGQLLRALELSPLPMYLLGESQEILFCNPACAAWTGVPAEELIGQVCRYHAPTGQTGPAAAAARLCPPPSIASTGPARGTVSALDTAGKLVFRQAEFLPLDPDSTGALLVVVTGSDSQQPDADVLNDPGAADLHAELQRQRHRWGARYSLDRLLGTSLAAMRVRAQVQLAGAAMANVLIVGPAGSGTEHVAKAIHYGRSSEAERGLLPLACATLGADTLVEMLERAFARAAAGHPDAPATLLLREIEALPVEVQLQLVRLMGTAAPLRVIATARQPLAAAVEQSGFRPDLAALVATLTIELPPLAERIEDLPLLAQVFLEELNASGSRQVAGFAAEALDRLAGYTWPGNLDELANVVREAHAQASGPEITSRDLPKRIHLAVEAAFRSKTPEAPVDLTRVLEQIETELIQRALARAKGNKSRAAELLGLTRPRLYRRLVQLGLSGDEEIEFEEAE